MGMGLCSETYLWEEGGILGRNLSGYSGVACVLIWNQKQIRQLGAALATVNSQRPGPLPPCRQP